MGAQPMPRPGVVRRGTSKAVPVVVSAGLAVGVFCGLLFGLGTGKEDEASAATSTKKDDDKKPDPKTPDKKPDTKVADTKAPDTKAPDTKTPDTKAPDKGSSDTKVADNSKGSGDKGSAAPAAHIAKLTLEIKPDPGPQAKITVDGKDMDPKKPFEIDLGTDKSKSVKLAITAPGFHSYEQKVDVNSDTSVTVELAKRAGVATNPTVGKNPDPTTHTPIITNTQQKDPGKKTGKKGSGVIDID
jgi:hypothetical protein